MNPVFLGTFTVPEGYVKAVRPYYLSGVTPYREGRAEAWQEKSIRTFNNCLDRGMSAEDAQAIAEITDIQAEAELRKRAQ